ncbi:9930_t:CDS:2 [Gigaspora rosea]|nr:9930_t:CDS:2 [Gigaspora rosea]
MKFNFKLSFLVKNENKNEIISRELEENSSSFANFEFNNLIPGFTNSGIPNSGSVGCGLSSLVDLEFSGFALGSDSASMLPGAISLCFKNVSPKLKLFLTNIASARFRPSAMSSGYNDVSPSAIRFRFQDVSPSAISSGFQDVSAGAISSGFQDVSPGANKDVSSDAMSSGLKDFLPDAISFESQDVLSGAISFGSQDVLFGVD